MGCGGEEVKESACFRSKRGHEASYPDRVVELWFGEVGDPASHLSIRADAPVRCCQGAREVEILGVLASLVVGRPESVHVVRRVLERVWECFE